MRQLFYIILSAQSVGKVNDLQLLHTPINILNIIFQISVSEHTCVHKGCTCVCPCVYVCMTLNCLPYIQSTEASAGMNATITTELSYCGPINIFKLTDNRITKHVFLHSYNFLCLPVPWTSSIKFYAYVCTSASLGNRLTKIIAMIIKLLLTSFWQYPLTH